MAEKMAWNKNKVLFSIWLPSRQIGCVNTMSELLKLAPDDLGFSEPIGFPVYIYCKYVRIDKIFKFVI